MSSRTTSTSPPQPQQRHVGTKTVAIALAGLIALTGFSSGDSSRLVSETEANWVSAEHAQSTGVSAGTISPPTSLSCEAPLLIGRPTLEWDHPNGGPPERYIIEIQHNATGNINHYVIEDGTLNELRLSNGILRNLLGNLLGLGGTFTARIQAAGPEEWEWTSESSNPVEFYPGLLGLIAPSCD